MTSSPSAIGTPVQPPLPTFTQLGLLRNEADGAMTIFLSSPNARSLDGIEVDVDNDQLCVLAGGKPVQRFILTAGERENLEAASSVAVLITDPAGNQVDSRLFAVADAKSAA